METPIGIPSASNTSSAHTPQRPFMGAPADGSPDTGTTL
jgi:hypothetical protein